MFLTKLIIPRETIKSQRITDTYSIHRLVYSCFTKLRKSDQESSGILYAEKQGVSMKKEILILSKHEPQADFLCQIETKEITSSFLRHNFYKFEIVLNPVKRNNVTGKIIPLKTSAEIGAWFLDKSQKFGFTPKAEHLEVVDIYVDVFEKKSQQVTLAKAKIIGLLQVTDHELFKNTFTSGIGRAKAFGCGLLQLQAIN